MEASDSVFMYEIDNNLQKLTETTTIGDRGPSLEELDPSIELAVDLQDLIHETNPPDSLSSVQAQFNEILNQLQLQGNANVGTNFVNNLLKPPYQQVVVKNSPAVVLPVQEANSQMPHLEWIPPNDQVVVQIKTEATEEPSTLDIRNFLDATNQGYFDFAPRSPEGAGVTVAEGSSQQASPLESPTSPYSIVSPTSPYSHTAPTSPYSQSSSTSPYSPSSFKSPAPGKSRRKHLDKGTEEYKDRRERNNIAVRKSRDKAKRRQQDTEYRVKELTSENEQLQKKVDLLSKELTVLKGLFTNVGAAMPEEFKRQFELLAQK